MDEDQLRLMVSMLGHILGGFCIYLIKGMCTVVDNQSLPILLWPNCSWKSFNFAGSYSALKKESIAHFSVFLANCLGVGQNFEGQKM
jgi:hypothetical protein